MKVGFLYGGQGSQVAGMGLDFYEKEDIARDYYNSINIDKDVRKLSFFSSEEEIKITENTQVVLIAFQVMITKMLKSIGIKPDAAAGLSIGEFSALYAAGVLSDKDTLKIANFRGKVMTYISKNMECAMYAVMGMTEKELEDICTQSEEKGKVYISNLNTKNQIVISGEKSACLKAVELIENIGKRAVPLKVSGAFHTEYMNEASEKLREYFKDTEFKNENINVYFNLLGTKNMGMDIREIMALQVKRRVRFEDIIRNMINDGIDTFIEIGYGNIIKGFIKKIDRNVKVHSVSDYKSFEELKGVFNE